MGWFNRKPRDLIADSNAEWDIQRAIESRNGALIVPAEMGLSAQEFYDQMRVAAGGWCAPSAPGYDLLSLPEIVIKRGGIKWPTS